MNIPTLTAVASSQIAEIGHDAESNKLFVRFNPKEGQDTGPLYFYDGVDADIYGKFLLAPSTGSHFYKHIKGKFPYTKLEGK